MVIRFETKERFMKRKFGTFLGFAVMIIISIFAIIGCSNSTGNGDDDVSNEQLFADMWVYFGCPDSHNWSDNNGLTENSGFDFYKKSYDIEDLNIIKAYWDSLPDDKTFYYSREESYHDSWDDESNSLRFELQLHRGEAGNTWFQIDLFYPVDGKMVIVIPL
jgi:hypothetical protein